MSTTEFEVRPFAFMRLTHEAIRAGRDRAARLADALVRSPSEPTLHELEACLGETRQCLTIHARQEDRGFFPLLDRLFDGVATDAGFGMEHEAEDAAFVLIDAALARARSRLDRAAAAAVHGAVASWAADNERHLVHEEDIMMPLTQQVDDTSGGRALAVRGIIDAGDRRLAETWQIPWVVAQLERSQPFGPVRMYVEAVRAAHEPADWARIAPGIRGALASETAARLEALGAL